MIVICAPYSRSGRNLGATRKVNQVLGVLLKLDSFIILIDSSHDINIESSLKIEIIEIFGKSVIFITPPTKTNTLLGKFLNIFDVNSVIKTVNSFGTPRLVWLYNGYAFESIFGYLADKTWKCKVILEFEDWHFARTRGLNPKPYLDFFFWRLLAPKLSHCFAVNSILAQKLEPFFVNVDLLPCIVSSDFFYVEKFNPPFYDPNIVTVGYFGGLSNEKGADKVAMLADLLPHKFHFIVTGCGPLYTDMIKQSKRYPNRFMFYGHVGDSLLVELMSHCDVLLNPHQSITAMYNGIFPFKIVEYIATGRLVVSTSLPTQNYENVLSGVCFVDDTIDDLVLAVKNSYSFFQNNFEFIKSARKFSIERFSSDTLLARLTTLVND